MKKSKKYYGIAMLLIAALLVGSLGMQKADAASCPAKPSFKVTKRTKTTATIKITKKGKVSGYQVYLKSSKKGKYKLVMGMKSRTYKFTKLKKNKTYYVKVRAFRTKGARITFGKSSVKKIGKYKASAPKPTTKPTKAPGQNSQTTSDKDAQKYAKEVLTLVNKERKAEGLTELTLDDTLCAAANKRAKEIVEKFSHTRPDGKDCFSVLSEYDYTYTNCGENIAAGQSTPAEVMDSWMNSEGHRANILTKEFTKLGVGYYKVSTGYTYYWVQLFSN